MTNLTDDFPAVVETQVVHDTHRKATSLLADAAGNDSAHPGAVRQLRDFVVAMLQHHHEREDHDLWPLLTDAAPTLTEPLDALSREHERLDDALDGLRDGADATAAATVRDLLHAHLAHEEPILFPALREHVSDGEWAAFSQRIVASAPKVGTPLLLCFFYEVGSDDEVALILRHLPAEVQAMVPALRAEGERTLASLRGRGT